MTHRESAVLGEQSRSRRFGVRLAPFVMAGAALALLPAGAIAVDTTVEPQRNAAVVFVVVILLFGSVTAGIFFASPLRNWLGGARARSADPVQGAVSGLSAPIGDGLPPMPGGDIFGNEYDTDFPAAPQAQTARYATTARQPLPAPQPVVPPPARHVAPPSPPKPAPSPWSTGGTRPDPNWGRRDVS